jgi:hypothetical protein
MYQHQNGAVGFTNKIVHVDICNLSLMLCEASLPFTQIQGFLIEGILLVSRTGCKKQSEANGREAG